MNYYDEIKYKLINNEVYKKAKDYSKNKSDLDTYYEVGMLLALAGSEYGEDIIGQYSKKLYLEVNAFQILFITRHPLHHKAVILITFIL